MEKVEYLPVQYAKATPIQGNRQQQAVRYIEVPEGAKLAAAPRGRQQGKQIEYVMMPRNARRAAPPRREIRRQQLRIGGAGVKKGAMLDDDEEEEEEGEDGDEAPAAVTPPTPEEIAKALQRIQERQIQEQSFHDTLVDAQTGQPLHVPGVAGSAHNGVSGIGIFAHTLIFASCTSVPALQVLQVSPCLREKM